MDSTASRTSTTLLRKVADGGDEAAETQFFNNYSRIARAVVLKACVPAHSVDDVIQEALIAAFKTLREGKYIRQGHSWRLWLKGIVRNKVLHARRDAARALPTAASLPEVADASSDPAKIVEKSVQGQLIAIALEKAMEVAKKEVDEDTWGAFYLVVLKKRPAKEVATQLGISRGAVDSAIFRIRQRLAAILSRTR